VAADEREDPPAAGTEIETLTGFLQYLRDTVVMKASGLTADQVRATPTVSELSLAGLLKHLALVEESWIIETFRGEPPHEPWASVDWAADRDWDFHSAKADDPAWLVDRYRQAWSAVDAVVRGSRLDDLSVVEPTGADGVRERVSLRWILVHLIEETARHAGHADLIREALDGSTGE
jgi:uncharacterized damage-inducible protein DinB